MQRASFFVALGQLLVGLLLYFHIEPTWIGNNIQWTRDNWILFFLFGGLAFTGFGLYRTFRPRVNVRNIERKIVEWLQAVRLGYDEHHFQPWHFTYVVIFRGLRTFIGRPRALSGRYLQVEARITPAPGELAQRLEKLNQRDQNDFYKALALEAAKARIYYNWNSANDLSIIKWLPITNQLSDASILDSLT